MSHFLVKIKPMSCARSGILVTCQYHIILPCILTVRAELLPGVHRVATHLCSTVRGLCGVMIVVAR